VAPYEGTWLDVGRPWELLEANELALAKLGESDGPIAGTVEEGVHLHGPVVIEEGALVRSGAYIEGPALIREARKSGRTRTSAGRRWSVRTCTLDTASR